MFNNWIFLDNIICYDCFIYFYIWYKILILFFLVLINYLLGVASNLEKKSRENARKMSSLVGMAGKTISTK